MPGVPYSSVVVSAQGVSVGSYLAKVLLKDSRTHGHEGPQLDRGQRWLFLSFQDITAPIVVGQAIAIPGLPLSKVYDVRRYQRSLQVDLQRMPYAACDLWLPSTLAAGAQGNFRVATPTYTKREAPLLAYIEPFGEQEKAYVAASIGNATQMSAQSFSIEPIPNTACVVYQYDSNGRTVTEYWMAIANSAHYPVTEDYRTAVKYLDVVPTGVVA
jgi:hypothetical protein